MSDTIQIQDRTFDCPTGWNDLPLKKLYISYLTFMVDTDGFFAADEILWFQRIAIFRNICDIDDSFVIQWRSHRQKEHGLRRGTDIFHAELRTLTKTATQHLFETTEDEPAEGNEIFRIALNLTRCPYPQLDMRPNTNADSVWWYAPADGLENITFYELAMTFSAFELYAQTNDITHAHRLLAILYRPGKPETAENIVSNYEGDRRLPLQRHESTIDDRADKLRLLPHVSKQLIIFWFASCRQQIIEGYPKVFKAATGTGNQGADYGYGGLILRLADNLANVNAIAEQPFGNVLTKLSMLEDDRVQMEIEKTKLR